MTNLVLFLVLRPMHLLQLQLLLPPPAAADYLLLHPPIKQCAVQIKINNHHCFSCPHPIHF